MKKRILVFGAGSGIGKALLEKLSNGSFGTDSLVIGFSRRGEAQSSSFQHGKNYHLDLSEKDLESKLTRFFEMIDFEKGDVCLYFAQGDGLFQPVQNVQKEDVSAHFQLNVFSILAILKQIYPYISKMNNLTLVFLSSTASKMGFPNSSSYVASKHSVAGIAKSIREEWKDLGVKVVNVYLGAVYTEIWNERTEFSPSDMISVTELADFLSNFSFLPKSLYVDEVHITPRKGIL